MAVLIFSLYYIPEISDLLHLSPEKVIRQAIVRYKEDEELRNWIDLMQREVWIFTRIDVIGILKHIDVLTFVRLSIIFHKKKREIPPNTNEVKNNLVEYRSLYATITFMATDLYN